MLVCRTPQMLHEVGGDTVEGDTHVLLFVFLCPPDPQKATEMEPSAGHQPFRSEGDKPCLCAVQPAPVQDTVGEVVVPLEMMANLLHKCPRPCAA